MKSTKFFALWLLVVTIFATLPVAAERNLIKDGGFELDLVEPGSFKQGLGFYGAWTSSSADECAGSTEILGLPLPHALGLLGENTLLAYEGDEAINLGPCFGNGKVSQTFRTTVGTRYKVSLAAIGGTVTVAVFNASKIDFSANFHASENMWGTYNYTFEATHTDTTITVENTSPRTGTCCAPTIDDVRIVPAVMQ